KTRVDRRFEGLNYQSIHSFLEFFIPAPLLHEPAERPVEEDADNEAGLSIRGEARVAQGGDGDFEAVAACEGGEPVEEFPLRNPVEAGLEAFKRAAVDIAQAL